MGVKEITYRAEELAALALKIWPRPRFAPELLAVYRPTPDQSQRQYALADLELLTGQTMDLFRAFSTRVMNIHSSVTQAITKNYVAYKTTTNFVDVIPQKTRLKLSLNMRFDEIIDPRGLCEDLTGRGKWGNGDVQVFVDASTDMDYIMDLIMQSFNKHAEDIGE